MENSQRCDRTTNYPSMRMENNIHAFIQGCQFFGNLILEGNFWKY